MCIETVQANEIKELCAPKTIRKLEPRPIDEELCNIAYERGQIGGRIRKLEAAIKVNPEAVSEHHKELWKSQLNAMKDYYNILGDRIKDFVNQTERK